MKVKQHTDNAEKKGEMEMMGFEGALSAEDRRRTVGG